VSILNFVELISSFGLAMSVTEKHPETYEKIKGKTKLEAVTIILKLVTISSSLWLLKRWLISSNRMIRGQLHQQFAVYFYKWRWMDLSPSFEAEIRVAMHTTRVMAPQITAASL